MDWKKYSNIRGTFATKIKHGLFSVSLHYDSLEGDDEMFSKAYSYIMDWVNFCLIDSVG